MFGETVKVDIPLRQKAAVAHESLPRQQAI
jgi:hypothetical protein